MFWRKKKSVNETVKETVNEKVNKKSKKFMRVFDYKGYICKVVVDPEKQEIIMYNSKSEQIDRFLYVTSKTWDEPEHTYREDIKKMVQKWKDKVDSHLLVSRRYKEMTDKMIELCENDPDFEEC